MIQKFLEKGYKITEDRNEKADIWIINTCTVTNMSDRKSRQMIRKIKDSNPNATIIAIGCYVQVAKPEVEKIEEVDLILGNDKKSEIVKYLEEYLDKKNKITKIEDIMKNNQFLEFGDVLYTEKTRAVIKVQDGCDNYCSYCIIPFARGRVRSRNPESVISEITKIAQTGIKEVVITGIHIASYGKDFKNDYRLIDLLEEINKIDGIKRIRLGSIEPLLITEKFVNRLKKLEKICHHFHLSLQSGCDDTLKRMNRRYNTQQFKDVVELLRSTYNDVNITTDIIVGFPGETEDEFEKTYKFLKTINFYKMHIFKYSPRKGTSAAKMKNQVSSIIKEERSKKLIQLSNKCQKKFNEKYLNQVVEVLFEEKKQGLYRGHTQNYVLVIYKDNSNKEFANKLMNVKCIESKEEYIIAEGL